MSSIIIRQNVLMTWQKYTLHKKDGKKIFEDG